MRRAFLAACGARRWHPRARLEIRAQRVALGSGRGAFAVHRCASRLQLGDAPVTQSDFALEHRQLLALAIEHLLQLAQIVRQVAEVAVRAGRGFRSPTPDRNAARRSPLLAGSARCAVRACRRAGFAPRRALLNWGQPPPPPGAAEISSARYRHRWLRARLRPARWPRLPE